MKSTRTTVCRTASWAALLTLALAPASLAGPGPSKLTNQGIVAPPLAPRSQTFQGTDHTDFNQYEAAAGPQTCIDFTDLSDGTTVTTQYLAQGVEFTDGDDVVLASGAFVQDGQGLDASGRVHLFFAEPRTSIGVFFPGALVIEVFDAPGGTSLHTSQQFGSSGTGFFGGVTTTTPFTFVELRDPNDDSVFPDDICFGASDDSAHDQIEAKLDMLEPKVDGLADAVDSLEAKADRSEGKLDSLEAKADRSEGKLDSLEAKADRSEGKLDSLEAKADRSEGKLDSLEAKADRSEGKLDSLEAKADRSEGKLDALEGKMDRVEAKLDRLEALVCELIRLELTPLGQRSSDACGTCLRFPEGKSAGGCVATAP